MRISSVTGRLSWTGGARGFIPKADLSGDAITALAA